MAVAVAEEALLSEWQGTVDTMAELAGVPAGLIMRVDGDDTVVHVSSATEGNPYNPGDREHLAGSGLYCERVVTTREKLLVPDARADDVWARNPDIKLSMYSYLGFPLMRPDGKVFGTLCVLDSKGNSHSPLVERLMLRFKALIEAQLALATRNRELEERLSEVRTLQGIIPICAHCRRVRDDAGFWAAVEDYIARHSEAEMSHGICPDCMQVHYPEITRKLHDAME